MRFTLDEDEYTPWGIKSTKWPDEDHPEWRWPVNRSETWRTDVSGFWGPIGSEQGFDDNLAIAHFAGLVMPAGPDLDSGGSPRYCHSPVRSGLSPEKQRAHLFVDRTDVCVGPLRWIPRSTTDRRSAGVSPAER